jgi:hypothetical protein
MTDRGRLETVAGVGVLIVMIGGAAWVACHVGVTIGEDRARTELATCAAQRDLLGAEVARLSEHLDRLRHDCGRE